MSVTITSKMLQTKKACASQICLFEETFGPSATFKSLADLQSACVEHAGKFKWSWAARELLSKSARAKYERAKASAWAECERAMAPFLAEYDRAVASAWTEYGRAMASARAEYERAIASARAEYKRAMASARAEYERAMAFAWAQAFWNDSPNLEN